MTALRQAIVGQPGEFRRIAVDEDLRSLQHRPDFRRLILDRIFPGDPFARDR